MLKLVYHSAAFGSIDLEYDRPVIRVGRSEDNDLVLRDPSIEAHHCLLVFRGEKVLCLPPNQAVNAQSDLRKLTGVELGPGDPLTIGDLQFSLAHSSNTVALPEIRSDIRVQSPAAAAGRDDSTAGRSEPAGQAAYYCSSCKAFFRETEVKRVGLVGYAKRNLCPKCSSVLEVEPEAEQPPAAVGKGVPQRNR